MRSRLPMFLRVILTASALTLGACSTVQPPAPIETPDRPAPQPEPDNTPTIVTLPDVPPAPTPIPAPRKTPPAPPEVDVIIYPSAYDSLPHWNTADFRPAMTAFVKGCAVMNKGDLDDYLNPNVPRYGQYSDWRVPCAVAENIPNDNVYIRRFFEDYFTPVDVGTRSEREGLLTGYYEPEIEVRARPDAVFSEPILERPKDPARQALPRSLISANTSKVIAYGRPIDVFFMQIQGSGRIRLDTGRTVRAAFNGHNSRKYVSIGKVLIERGELESGKASKGAIEDWMNAASPSEVRELMNENPRYVFFKAENIIPSEGPKGAMRVPLTGMGSIAIDPRYHPYGTPYWLETTLPTFSGDFRGSPTGRLVIAQDTGGAIKGPLRGDFFFGSGDAAGKLAGVQKHPARWTVLLPAALVDRTSQIVN